MTRDAAEPQEGLGAEFDSESKRLGRLRQILDRAGVPYRILSHETTVISADMGVERGVGSLEEMAPTLILRSEKGLWAAVISGRTRLSYKKIKRELGLKDISLASAEMVQQATGAQVGTVSLINEGLPTIVDVQLAARDVIYGGCGIPRHTLCLRAQDLIAVTGAQVFDFTEPRNGAR